MSHFGDSFILKISKLQEIVYNALLVYFWKTIKQCHVLFKVLKNKLIKKV